ncbi:glycosyltransferase [Robertkochia marina]|nr:glycosyltransferase [Robertkochia marina]
MERIAYSFYSRLKTMNYAVYGLKIIKKQNDLIQFGDDEIYLSLEDLGELNFLKRIFFYKDIPSRLNEIIKKKKITHSISFGDFSNFFSSISGTKEIKIASLHGVKSIEFKNKSVFNWLFKRAYKNSYQNFRKVVAISKHIQNDLINNCHYPFSNIEVIYNPHNIENIRKLSVEKLDNNYESALFSKPVIIFVGRITYQKAPWHLISIFNQLNKTHDQKYNLIFIGDGDPKIKQILNNQIVQFKIAEQVHFLGAKENPYKYLNRASVLALSSYYEGTPNVIVEAIALSIPTICTNCTSGIEEIMSLGKDSHNSHNQVINTSAGLIAPKLEEFNPIDKTWGEMPKSLDKAEVAYMNGLQDILNDNSKYKNQLLQNQDDLLKKFEIDSVLNSYFK